MTDKQIIDRVNVKECKYYCNGKCERYEEFVEADYADYSVKCICEKENDLGTYDICDYQQLKAKEQECEELKNDKFALEVHINSLTSPVNIEDCEHSVYNGEYVACRYYEGCRCDDLDFANCMFRENVRLKQQLDQLKAENKILKEKFEIAIKNNMDKTLLRLKNGDVQEELQEIREQFGIETLYFHDDNTRAHRCLDILILKNVLTEIKELVNKLVDNKGYAEREEDKILQKISEVVDETTK